MLSLFLANFEVTIVSTSLVAIADDLKGFSESSWVVTAYMLTYTGNVASFTAGLRTTSRTLCRFPHHLSQAQRYFWPEAIDDHLCIHLRCLFGRLWRGTVHDTAVSGPTWTTYRDTSINKAPASSFAPFKASEGRGFTPSPWLSSSRWFHLQSMLHIRP